MGLVLERIIETPYSLRVAGIVEKTWQHHALSYDVVAKRIDILLETLLILRNQKNNCWLECLAQNLWKIVRQFIQIGELAVVWMQTSLTRDVVSY